MKNTFVGLAVLLMAGPALAWSGGAFVITGPGGVSSYAPAPGEVFDITVSIVPPAFDPGEAMAGWQLHLTAPSDYKLGKSQGTAYHFGPGVAAGWDPNQSVPFPMWSSTSDVPFPLTFNVGTGAVDIFTGITVGGPVFTAKIVAPAVITPGVMISADDPRLGDTNFTDHTDVAIVGLQIIPEPVSMLLLLAGLPMLRRRR